MLLDLQRIIQAARRRYGAEGNTGKYGISNLDLSCLVFCLSLRCHASWSCIVFYFCGLTFFPWEIKFTDFELHPLWCWASHLQSHVRTWASWRSKSCAGGLGGCSWVGETPLGCSDNGCCGQGDVVHVGAAAGTHLNCSCGGTTRAGGMCSLLSSHIHLFSQCSKLARTAPLASSTCVLQG